jgi:hypothetical protein
MRVVMKVYRIYDPVSKLYSTGGLHNVWTKNGKLGPKLD